MPTLRMGADEEDKLGRLAKTFKNTRTPMLCTFRSWRQVPAVFIVTRKTEAHWDNSDFSGVVKFSLCHSHPGSQADAGGIGKGDAGSMGASAGSLAADKKLRSGT